jgi:hypothetical protein
MNKPKSFWRDNGLSIVIVVLFVAATIGQALAGYYDDASERCEHAQAAITFASYLQTGAFGEAIFENWESEFLQMGLYVILTSFLVQRGSAESSDPDEPEQEPPRVLNLPAPARATGLVRVLYSHSLSIALLALFALSFTGHALCGASSYNDEAAAHGSPTLSVWGYLASSRFWFESFQNWQSEFLSILAIVVLSIWLREKGSPESKAVTDPHAKTGA